MKRKPAANEPVRLNRYMAQCGLCSRRQADEWIRAGRVAVDGEVVHDLGRRVGSNDAVTVDGRPVTPLQRHTYILYHKPKGLMCSRKDAKGRPLIYDKLDLPANVQSVGRLDMDSEGLLLLSDDGELTQRLLHPGAHMLRQYRVRVRGHIDEKTLELLRRGDIDMGRGERSVPWEVTVDAETRGHTWLTVSLRRGRWREVRRTLEACGHPVQRLIRTHFGPLSLDADMPAGAWRPLSHGELRRLRQAVAKV